MPLAPILNQGEHRWFTFNIETMCLNTIAVFAAIITSTARIFSSMGTSTASVIPAVAVDTADVTGAVNTGIDAGACKD